MTVSEQRIPPYVISAALQDLVYRDALIPHSVGESQRSWHVRDASLLTYVETGKRFATKYITNQAELLAAIAYMIDETRSDVIRLDEQFGEYLYSLRFVNCNRPEYVLTQLAALRITMVVGNIDYAFHLGHFLRDSSGLPYFQIGPELLAACDGMYENRIFLEDYSFLSQPLTRRIYRAFARRGLKLWTPYTAEQLCHTLRLYRPAQTATSYVLEPLPMDQIRQRLFRVQNELILAEFISVIREDKVDGKSALTFLPGGNHIPDWRPL